MLRIAFGLSALIILVVGSVSYLNFDKNKETIESTLSEATPLFLHTKDLASEMLILPRFEKDFFLNIGKPEKQTDSLA